MALEAAMISSLVEDGFAYVAKLLHVESDVSEAKWVSLCRWR
jgi:hypothetical protein